MAPFTCFLEILSGVCTRLWMCSEKKQGVYGSIRYAIEPGRSDILSSTSTRLMSWITGCGSPNQSTLTEQQDKTLGSSPSAPMKVSYYQH